MGPMLIHTVLQQCTDVEVQRQLVNICRADLESMQKLHTVLITSLFIKLFQTACHDLKRGFKVAPGTQGLVNSDSWKHVVKLVRSAVCVLVGQ